MNLTILCCFSDVQSLEGIDMNKLFDELGWEHLHHKREYEGLIHFYKIVNGAPPDYLSSQASRFRCIHYKLRNIPLFNAQKTQPITNKKNLFNCIRTKKHPVFKINDIEGIKN